MAKTITASQIFKIIESQNYICALSGRKLTPETASVDHIVPLSKKGTHDLSNIWIIDLRVNHAKGTMSVDEFVSMCKDVARFQESKNIQNNNDNNK